MQYFEYTTNDEAIRNKSTVCYRSSYVLTITFEYYIPGTVHQEMEREDWQRAMSTPSHRGGGGRGWSTGANSHLR